MAGCSILWVASLLAAVKVAVEGTVAGICALEHARPFFQDMLTVFGDMVGLTGFLVTSIGAENGLFYLATIATSVDSNFASSA